MALTFCHSWFPNRKIYILIIIVWALSLLWNFEFSSTFPDVSLNNIYVYRSEPAEINLESLLIISSPESEITTYPFIADLFNNIGITTCYNSNYYKYRYNILPNLNEYEIIVSWLYSFDNNIRFKTIMHLISDPLKSITSIFNNEPIYNDMYQEFISKYINWLNDTTMIKHELAMILWYEWNLKINELTKINITIKMEDMFTNNNYKCSNTINYIIDNSIYDIDNDTDILHICKNINQKYKKQYLNGNKNILFNWNDLIHFNEEYALKIYELATKKYGYTYSNDFNHSLYYEIKNNKAIQHRKEMIKQLTKQIFIYKLVKQTTNETIKCNPFNYNFISILLNEIKLNLMVPENNKFNSSEFDKMSNSSSSVSSCTINGGHKKDILRLKSINHTLYHDSLMSTAYNFKRSFVNYFEDLFNKYSNSIDSFDILIHTIDSRQHKFEWNNNHKYFPCFVSEGKQYNKNNVLLYTIGRGFVRRDYGTKNSRSLFIDSLKKTYISKEEFLIKKNVAVFRGSSLNLHGEKIRDRVVYYVNNKIDTQHFKYFNVKFVHHKQNEARAPRCGEFNVNNSYNSGNKCWITYKDSMKYENESQYKYIIVMDGLGVRDAFSRQILYNSIILKQESNAKEFWYYDLIDGKHLFLFKNETDLYNIMLNIINNFSDDQLYQISLNAKQYAIENLNQDGIDCFVINLLKIYNHFIFDPQTIKIGKYDVNLLKAKYL